MQQISLFYLKIFNVEEWKDMKYYKIASSILFADDTSIVMSNSNLDEFKKKH